jgi:hypothetical protein
MIDEPTAYRLKLVNSYADLRKNFRIGFTEVGLRPVCLTLRNQLDRLIAGQPTSADVKRCDVSCAAVSELIGAHSVMQTSAEIIDVFIVIKRAFNVGVVRREAMLLSELKVLVPVPWEVRAHKDRLNIPLRPAV